MRWIVCIFPFAFFFVLAETLRHEAKAQFAPSPPTWVMGENQDAESFANLLRGDLMRRFQQEVEQFERERAPGQRPQRPRANAQEERERSTDISRFLGPDADPEKTLQRLFETMQAPSPEAIPAPPPPSATQAENDLWGEVSLEKRVSLAEDLLRRRRFVEARDELERILSMGDELTREQRIRALVMREKALFQSRHYKAVEQDLFRLEMFYPEENEIQELRNYLETESGIKALQKSVMENARDPQAQQNLVNRYVQLGWLDLAEEFFASTIQDTSPITVKSLSEIYYRKNDFDMLVNLSKAALQLHPNTPEFLYNKGIGLYNRGDALSREQAREAFLEAKRQSRNPQLTSRIDWYLHRLANIGVR